MIIKFNGRGPVSVKNTVFKAADYIPECVNLCRIIHIVQRNHVSNCPKRSIGVVKYFVTTQLSGSPQFDNGCFVAHRADITQR
jgi:hypothetical protein